MEKTAPVKEGDIIKGTIDGIGNNGDPMIRHEKFVLFLKETEGLQVGDTVDVKVVRVMQTYGLAELNK